MNTSSNNLTSIKNTNNNANYLVQNNADLISLNTMRLTSIADKLITVYSETDVENCVKNYKENNTPIFILSGGSNIILPPQLKACVIKPALLGKQIVHESDEYIEIEVMAGENWHEFVKFTINKGWYGLENLALIPGLVGASPVQNIGAYGVQLEDCLADNKTVRAFHIPTLTWHEFNKSQCQFSYRDSKFKREAGQWIITKVRFKLHNKATLVCTNYGDVFALALNLAKKNNRHQPSAVDVMNAVIKIRQSKLPNPKILPNCGSFFKNPIIDNQQFATLKLQYPNIVGYSVDDNHTKVAAGWLIDAAGLKGQGIKPVLTHINQALVLVNHTKADSLKPASQDDVYATQHLIQNKVNKLFNINLEREPIWLDAVANYQSS